MDELSVTEVASNPYFPSMFERKQSNHVMEDSAELFSKSETDASRLLTTSDQLKIDDFDAQAREVFGMRRIHRCLVVTARARSFLYHQVRFRFLSGLLSCTHLWFCSFGLFTQTVIQGQEMRD